MTTSRKIFIGGITELESRMKVIFKLYSFSVIYKKNSYVIFNIVVAKGVEIIKETIGLQSLPEAVRKTAEARCENPGATLLELADILKVTKSCLNHRLRKINEIADNLK